jgi:hypothetical protein
LGLSMIEDAFWKWYSSYNPDLVSDEMVNELMSCWYAAWERSAEVGKLLQELSDLGQEFDNGHPKP